MALLTKGEFSSACGKASNWLSIYITRKKVEVTGDLIDTSVKINADFLKKWSERSGKTADTAAPPSKKKQKDHKAKPSVPESEEEIGPTSTDDALSRAKKYEEIVLKRVNRRIAELDEQKKMGELLPTDLVKSIFGTHTRSIITSFKDGTHLLIVKMSQKFQLSLDVQAEIKKELIAIINRSSDAAVRISNAELEKVMVEFSQTREVGEHG